MEMHLLQSFKEKNKEKSWMYLKFTENRICTLSCKWKPGEMATYFNYKLLANVTTFKFGGYIAVQTSQWMPCLIQKPTGNNNPSWF